MKKILKNCLRCKKEINKEVDTSQKYYICPECNVSVANILYDKKAKPLIKIYLAGGFFNEKQIKIIDFLEKTLDNEDNLDVYSPRRKAQILTGTIAEKSNRKKVFKANIDNIENADIIIASTEGKDMGTIFECGYAYAKKKPIIYVYLTDDKAGFNLMLSESGKVITKKRDVVTVAMILNRTGIDKEKLKQFDYEGVTE